ncbi:hypothetical protein TCAL_02466, partial [Tigriopus californicus]
MSSSRPIIICMCLSTFLIMAIEGVIAHESKASLWEKAKTFLGWTTTPHPPTPTPRTKTFKPSLDRASFYDEMAMLGAYQDFY